MESEAVLHRDHLFRDVTGQKRDPLLEPLQQADFGVIEGQADPAKLRGEFGSPVGAVRQVDYHHLAAGLDQFLPDGGRALLCHPNIP